MTRWVEDPAGGRARGPAGLVRAWAEVLVRPRRFFRTGVSPGDQAPGLVFAAAVVFVYAGTLLALSPAAPEVMEGRPGLAALALAVAVVLVAPAALHLVAAVQTVLLVPLAADRGGVGETVQVIGYASAPCVLAGVPVAPLQVACALYGTALLVVGLHVVHRLSVGRAALAGALPAALVFGYGFRGFAAAAALAAAVG